MENMESQTGSPSIASKISVKKRPKILLIDDDPLFRSLMVRLGEATGLDVEAFESMLEIEPFSRLNDYDGAIFDYYLGQQDGFDIVSHLKPFFATIPTILVSADADVASVCARNPKSGVRAFAHKSLGAVKILDKMRYLLRKKK